MKNIFLQLITLGFVFVFSASATDLRGVVDMEVRGFIDLPLETDQHDSTASFSIEPELYLDWNNGDQTLKMTPFYRWDQHDKNRTHADVREFFGLWMGNNYEIGAGISRVFWGVTESQHLVDIINQTDLVENPDGEDKFGQPMISSTLWSNWGNLEVYLLPYFRERSFPGKQGRLRTVPAVDSDNSLYESGDRKRHPDWALRWSHSGNGWDIGLSYFTGTGREPQFLINQINPGGVVLLPYYYLIRQAGLDIQGAMGAWLWKFEGIFRSSEADRFFALTGGFEYTLSALFSHIDMGFVVEYSYDERGNDSTTGFEDDFLLGVRLSPNDARNTQFLFGAIVDRDSGGHVFRIETSRRIYDSFKISAEAAVFRKHSSDDPLYYFRRDDFLQLNLAYYY